MKIGSFDVGCKNMAYCIIDINDENVNDFSIVKWDVFSIATDNIICDCNNKKKKCTSKALYTFNISEKNYCDKHKKEEEIIFNNSIEYDNKKEYKCEHLINDVNKCNKLATKKYDKIKYCDTHIKKYVYFTKLNQKSSGGEDLFILGVNLITKLNEINEFLFVDKVIIENQPSNLNPRMKSISNMLFSYFTNMYVNKINNKCLLNHVLFIHASNKLLNKKLSVLLNDDEENKEEVLEGGEIKTDKEKYNKRKKDGIFFTKKILNSIDDEVNLIKLLEHKKKDDLCDCFLQAYYYINK